MLGWFQALMPREDRFFDMFARHAAIVLAGAEALQGLLKGGDSIEQYRKQIFDREAQADEVTREVLTAVRRTFVTPFDRTDIQDLISSMDDAIDQMNKTAKTIVMFEVKSFEPPMQEMAAIIVEAAKLVVEAVPLLSSIGSNASRLNTLTGRIIAVEEQADEVHDRGLKALFLATKAKRARARLRQRHAFHRRHRDLRPSGEGRRPVRGCFERNKLDRRRSAVTAAADR